MKKEELLVFLDCEASSLACDSYPIEIAWNDESGNIESWLINPDMYPDSYTDWSYASQGIHGLSREFLVRKGHSPQVVAKRLNECLEGKLVLSDAPDWERFWLERLFDAVDVKMSFTIADYLRPLEKICPNPLKYHSIAKHKMIGREHRAGGDVSYLVELNRLCVGV